MFAVGLSYIAFIMLRYVPSIPAFWKFFFFFYHKWMLNFAKGFFCMYWDNHMTFIFHFVNVVYYINWFADIEESLHPWDKAHLIMIYDFFLNFTILYWLCHTSTWILHRYTCVPHPEPSSILSPRTIPLGRPSAPAPSIQYHALNLDWQLVSYMILYIFQCHSPKPSHPLPLPQSPKDCSIHLCLLLSCIQGYCYHLSKFHIYALVYCIGGLFLAYFTLYNRVQFHPPH